METEALLQRIVESDQLHSRFLNTLSYLENSGARKISASEHPEEVGLMQLKHAAEEHRHAYYLKKQIQKINPSLCISYKSDELLAPVETRQMLMRLDIETSRYLKKVLGLRGYDLKFVAYLFVTYAIEVRADELYPVYQNVLSQNKQKVMVKSIIQEEEGHLAEMTLLLEKFSKDWKIHAKEIIAVENKLFSEWIAALDEFLNQDQNAGSNRL